MKREKISEIIGEIDVNFIQEALMHESTETIEAFPVQENQKQKNQKGQGLKYFWQFHRTAACACLVILATAFSFTTAFAASESFRQAVISIFYPLYSDGEIKELDDGHRTSSFDERDMLLTFLDRFNAEKMENGILAKYESGYAYTLVSSNEIPKGCINCILAVVESSREDYRLLVTMEKIPYEKTTGIWQIVSYQVITEERADEILGEMPVYEPAE